MKNSNNSLEFFSRKIIIVKKFQHRVKIMAYEDTDVLTVMDRLCKMTIQHVLTTAVAQANFIGDNDILMESKCEAVCVHRINAVYWTKPVLFRSAFIIWPYFILLGSRLQPDSAHHTRQNWKGDKKKRGKKRKKEKRDEMQRTRWVTMNSSAAWSSVHQ